MAQQKVHSTTQEFIELVDIQDEVVFLKGRNAISILEVSSVNFFLLSRDEQDARIYGYMSFLNSLSFPVQIVITSKGVDISNYLKLLEQKIAGTQNSRIKEQLTLYKDFIRELIKGGKLLDKKIYVVVPFSYLEMGALTTVSKGQPTQDYNAKVKESLGTKTSTVMSQVQRMGLSSKILSGEELEKLFYELYNGETVSLDFNETNIQNVML